VVVVVAGGSVGGGTVETGAGEVAEVRSAAARLAPPWPEQAARAVAATAAAQPRRQPTLRVRIALPSEWHEILFDVPSAVHCDPPPGRRRAFLALGSNLGDRQGHLRTAVEGLSEAVAVSDVYETDPVGGPEQGPYLNCVVELATGRSPHELLALAHRLEEAAGRERGERWGPRTLDVDVLLVGDLKVDEPDLTVPHPRMWERGFVLAPLHDLAPELVPEGWDALAGAGVRRLGPL
jgi:2-amino-4-hydroxy-6-hydroxymethyldihydropteridine diphosphokinase